MESDSRQGDQHDEQAAEIAANLADVRQRIAAAAVRAGRDPEEITLVAVTKTQPFSAIRAAMAAGQRDFGENRLEELWEKVHQAEAQGIRGLRWHMIGTIQSRKSSQAIGPFVLIHAVDRLKIARRLSREAVSAEHVIPVLLEVNASGEETKFGFRPAELPSLVPDLSDLSGIRILGLMTMAPFVDDDDLIRGVFRGLRELRDRLAERFPGVEWRHLSMGMTNDFEIAVAEGATIVRVGSAIFGPRAQTQ